MQNTKMDMKRNDDNSVPEKARLFQPINFGEANRYSASLDPSLVKEPGCYKVYCASCPGNPVGFSKWCYFCGKKSCLHTPMLDFCCLNLLIFAPLCTCWCNKPSNGSWQGKDDSGTEFQLVLVDAERGTWACYQSAPCSAVSDTAMPFCWCVKA